MRAPTELVRFIVGVCVSMACAGGAERRGRRSLPSRMVLNRGGEGDEHIGALTVDRADLNVAVVLL